MKIRTSNAYKIFTVWNTLGMAFLAFLCVAPLIHVLAVSFSGNAAANSGLVGFWPVDFTTRAYEITLENKEFFRSFGVSVVRVLLATSGGLLVTVLAAYPLSMEEEAFRGRTFYAWLFVFTMLFSGGLIPSYMVIKGMGLMNTFWVLIIPGLVSVGNIILMLNFFRSIPRALADAAYIDGAGHTVILFKIYIPMSLASFATIGLFIMVGTWNEWFSGMIYISDSKMYPMATYLRQFLSQVDVDRMAMSEEDIKELSDRAVKFSQIFISLIPIMLVYPFIQRYFITGIKLGSVKE